MKKLSKYVFYQSKKYIGVCDAKNWEKYKYENAIANIVKMSILECTNDYMKSLIDIFNTDKKRRAEMIIDEIRNDIYCIISN